MKRTVVLLFISAVLFILALSGCSPASTPTQTSTPSPTATLPPGQEPIEIVSAVGPWPSWYENGKPGYNAGGPIVEITLKNVSSEPVILLEVTLDAGGVSPENPYVFDFDVSPARPLNPGQSISARRTLIGGGFGDTPLPLTISGRLEGNVLFFYVRSVVITPPPE